MVWLNLLYQINFVSNPAKSGNFLPKSYWAKSIDSFNSEPLLFIWFYLFRQSLKTFFSAFLFPITVVNVTSATSDLLFITFLLLPTTFSTSSASDLLSITFLLLPTAFWTANDICVSDDWKGVRFGKTLKFHWGLRGGISYMALQFTGISSRGLSYVLLACKLIANGYLFVSINPIFL